MTKETDISKQLNWRKIILPLSLGLGVAIFMLVSALSEVMYVKSSSGEGSYEWVDTNKNGKVDSSDKNEFRLSVNGTYEQENAIAMLKRIDWGGRALWFAFLALVMVVIRDLGYMLRLRILTDKQLTWRQTFDSIMLWEFSSALTPSVVGGSGIAIFILNREGINLGRSTATIFVTALLDEFFYIIMVPLVFIFISQNDLIPETWKSAGSVKTIFYAGYGFIILLTVSISAALLISPHGFKRLLMRLCSFKLTRRFLRRAIKLGDEIILASVEIKDKSIFWWLQNVGVTFMSWGARFFTLNFVMLIFMGGLDHLLIFGRQLVMWVIMLISPTPGSSGVAEYALGVFYDDMLPLAAISFIAIIWRLLTFLPYLFVGAAILPGWLKRTA